MSRIFVNFRDINVPLICKATNLESAGVRRRQGRALACREKWPSSRCYNLKDGHIGPPTLKEFHYEPVLPLITDTRRVSPNIPQPVQEHKEDFRSVNKVSTAPKHNARDSR